MSSILEPVDFWWKKKKKYVGLYSQEFTANCIIRMDATYLECFHYRPTQDYWNKMWERDTCFAHYVVAKSCDRNQFISMTAHLLCRHKWLISACLHQFCFGMSCN